MSENADLRAWLGRREERIDWINANRLAAWAATLDRADPFPLSGEAVPPGFHWTLFPPLTRQSELGRDGHPKKGDFLPPVTLPRRMWAGGRLVFLAPLRVGEEVRRVCEIERIEEKRGKAGPLVFVTVRHRLSGGAGPAIEEKQDIVYREAPQPGAPAMIEGKPAPRGPWRREIVPDDVLLFRYSALTFNGHRIHYDRRYVTEEEGYPGLMVHGPLLATLLLDLVRRHLPGRELERFSFRALRPTFDISPLAVDGGPGDGPDHWRLWCTDNRDSMAMEAEAWTR
ncbi:MAG: MaoC family dehydratase N-terminal domain-containing protein [Acidobacteriota bacterium]